MTRAIIIRHGETAWNLAGRYQGQEDSPLTPRGVAQAEAIAARLSFQRFDAIISSDLTRAVRTADIIAGRHPNTPRLQDITLRERSFGKLTGYTRKEALAKFPDVEKGYLSHDPDYRIPDGESLRDLYERSAKAINAWADKYPEGEICIVTHGGVLGQFLRYVLNIPLDQKRAYKFVNCAYTAFTRDDASHWLLHTWGDTHHLSQLGAEDDIR